VGNRLTSIIPASGAAARFKYDGDGNLVAKLVGNVTTYYIGGVYEVEVTNSTVTKKTTYYPAGGAMRVIDGNGDNVFYVLKDHLGSASVTLDAGGNIVAEMRYYPFGETRVSTGTIPTDKRFQSQREDSYIKLIHMGARWYHPASGRFISADSIVPNFANPQALNRYAFVLNNPLKYTDPTGHTSVCGFAYSDPECAGLNTAKNNGMAGGSSNTNSNSGGRVASTTTSTTTATSIINTAVETIYNWWELLTGPGILIAPPQIEYQQYATTTPRPTYTATAQPTPYATLAATRKVTVTPSKTATPTASPPPSIAIFYHGTTNASYESILTDGIRLPEPSEKNWFSGEYGQGFYTTQTQQEAIYWAYNAAGTGGQPVVLAIEVHGFTEMQGLSIKGEFMFDQASMGAYDVGPDYLFGPVVGDPTLGTQVKFNFQAFPQLKLAGIVMVLPPP
jgi:RHS repeat-associated protein